jgi:hypothetical protein
VVEIDAQRVLTAQRFHGVFRLTGIPFDTIAWTSILTIKGGKVVRAEGFMTRDEGMAAAGLAS